MENVKQRPLVNKILPGGLIIIFTIIAYIPSMNSDFVWDDDLNVTHNEVLKSTEGLKNIWLKPGAVYQYYPMVFTSFWIEHKIWGLNPYGYHIVNIILHALNALLLWFILMRLKIPGAWMASVIFGVHPVHVESVAWITERKNILSGFFYLSALLTYIKYSLSENSHIRLYIFSLFLFACAVLSKSVTCTLPAVALLILWWQREKLNIRDIAALTPMFILGVILGLTTLVLEQRLGAQGEEWIFTFPERLIIAGKSVWFYVLKIIWPHPIMFIYPRWKTTPEAFHHFLFPLFALFAIFLLWIFRKKIGKGPLVAVLIFGGTLMPALGFFNVYFMRFSFVQDHFQYLASISLIVLFISSSYILLLKIKQLPQGALQISGVIILAILMQAAWKETYKFKDHETLWRDTISKNPGAWIAYNNLGMVLSRKGQTREAMQLYNQALKINPEYTDALNNLGNLYLMFGKNDIAYRYYKNVLRINPQNSEALGNMGVIHSRKGNYDEAIKYFSEATRINPKFASCYYNWGNALFDKNELDLAATKYKKVIEINAEFISAHMNLAHIFTIKKQYHEAIEYYKTVLNINPGHKKALTGIKTLTEKNIRGQ